MEQFEEVAFMTNERVTKLYGQKNKVNIIDLIFNTSLWAYVLLVISNLLVTVFVNSKIKNFVDWTFVSIMSLAGLFALGLMIITREKKLKATKIMVSLIYFILIGVSIWELVFCQNDSFLISSLLK